MVVRVMTDRDYDGISSARPPATIDTSVAHIARIYDYWLGGKDNYAVDREAAEKALAAMPSIAAGVRANRAFLRRAVRYLAGEAGIGQFLDIGTGLPAADNTHEVAQSINPGSRIAYVDNDPIVLAHARALLTSSKEGATSYIDADLRDTSTILRAAAKTLDITQPVGLMLIAVLHMIPDRQNPYAVVAELLDSMPSGSYLVLSHPAKDILPVAAAEAERRLGELMAQRPTLRTHTEVTRFFTGLDLLAPGVVQLPRWRPEPLDHAGLVPMWGGVGRKS
jgi:hypothetical protein